MSRSTEASATPSWGRDTKSSRKAAAAAVVDVVCESDGDGEEPPTVAAGGGGGGWSQGAMYGPAGDGVPPAVPPMTGSLEGAGGGGGGGIVLLGLETSSVLAAVVKSVPPLAESTLAWETETETASVLG